MGKAAEGTFYWGLNGGVDHRIQLPLRALPARVRCGLDARPKLEIIRKKAQFFPWALGITLFTVLAALPVYAQRNVPLESTWTTDGTVESIVTTPTTVYIGGRFTYVGPETGGFVPLSSSTGSPTGVFPKVNGEVDTCIADGSGGWYFGGSFSRVGTAPRNGIAHILGNGEVDRAWNPGATGVIYGFIYPGLVRALALSDGVVYAGGDFTSMGGKTRRNIAALDAATGTVLAWDPYAADGNIGNSGAVYALAVSDGVLYVGGAFEGIGGQTRRSIAALDLHTALATAWDPDGDGYVRAMAVVGNVVYAGGSFGTIGGQSRRGVAALDATTGLANDWNPDIGNGNLYQVPLVATLAVSSGVVYVGGHFANIGLQTRYNIAALDAVTGLATDWNPSAFGPVVDVDLGGTVDITEVSALAVSGSTVYAAGNFTRIGGQFRSRLAALDAGTGLATSWDPHPTNFLLFDEFVRTLAVSGDIVFAGGGFKSAGGVTRHNIAALDARTGVPTAWNPNSDGYVVDAMALSGDVVYAAGSFTTIGGQLRNGIAALDATTGLATAWDPHSGSDSYVRTLAVSGGVVYVGGGFANIGGQQRRGVAALDANTGLATAWDAGVAGSGAYAANPGVSTLAVSGNVVYVAGSFSSIGGQPRNFIAALGKETALATDWAPNVDGNWSDPQVDAMAISGGTVYVGGSFTRIGGQPRDYLAALDTVTGLTTPWNPGANREVMSLAVSNRTVYAGGHFTSIGGQTRDGLAALDAVTGVTLDWKPNDVRGDQIRIAESITVSALAVSDSALYAGGSFSHIGGYPRSNFAQFNLQFDGDIDKDQKTDAVDLQLVINKVLGFQTEGNSDVNDDGDVNAVDVQGVINAILNAR